MKQIIEEIRKVKKNKCHDKGCTDTDNPYWGIGTDAGVEYSTRTKILNTQYLYQRVLQSKYLDSARGIGASIALTELYCVFKESIAALQEKIRILFCCHVASAIQINELVGGKKSKFK